MDQEAQLAALRDALQAALQSHQRMGKAAPCDCSLCHQIRDALGTNAGAGYRQRLREECAQVADWMADQAKRLAEPPHPEKGSAEGNLAVKIAREIAARIRLLDSLSH